MKTALVVLGMHRSGTSSVAGTLTLLGAAPPRTLMAPAADNPRGFWESDVVMTLDDALLAEGGATWSDWRALANVAPAIKDPDPRILAALRDEFGEADIVVLKDPRMCRLFRAWRTALAHAGYRVLVITPLRTPAEVAASLQARNPLSRDQALRLWMRHVLEAEAASRGLPRHFMEWSSFMSDWRVQVAVMNGRLGTSLEPAAGNGAAAIDAFLTSDLYRQRSEEAVPAPVSETWAALTDLARHGEHPDLGSRLDVLRRDFERACTLFADAP
jgi:hypothetical protein